MERTVVFDMHGIVFCHSPDFDIAKSGELFEEKIRQCSNKKGYENAWKDYQDGIMKQALEIERISILKGMGGDSSELQVYEMPDAINCILNYAKTHKVVFVSTSEAETSKTILNYLFRQYKVQSAKEKVESFGIINMDDYGSKKDVNAWKSALKPYKNITDIYEDREKNLKSAGEAAKELGSNPKLHLSANDWLVQSRL